MESGDVPAFAAFAFMLVLWICWGLWFVVKAYNRTDPWWGRPRRAYVSHRRRQAARDAVMEHRGTPDAVTIDMNDINYSAVVDEKQHAISEATVVITTGENMASAVPSGYEDKSLSDGGGAGPGIAVITVQAQDRLHRDI